MIRPEFIVFVGFPAAGKSTLAEQFRNYGFVVHSPDAIRNLYGLHDLKHTSKVFDILHNEILGDIQQGKNIVYDSTNLTVYRRKKVIELVRGTPYIKICYVFTTPLAVCKARNRERVGYAKITERDYNIMSDVYKEPTIEEGWDIIRKVDCYD